MYKRKEKLNMDKYDSGKMKSCAQDILSELKTYSAARSDADSIVTNLRNNWQDATNTQYSNKYNTEAKVSAENVEKLMKQFADALTKSADAFDELHKKAQQDIG